MIDHHRARLEPWNRIHSIPLRIVGAIREADSDPWLSSHRPASEPNRAAKANRTTEPDWPAEAHRAAAESNRPAETDGAAKSHRAAEAGRLQSAATEYADIIHRANRAETAHPQTAAVKADRLRDATRQQKPACNGENSYRKLHG
jgi:hypothetical protein